MKTLVLISISWLALFAFISPAHSETITEITLTSGRILKNIQVIRWEKERVVLKYSGGADPIAFSLIKSIPLKDLYAMRDAALEEMRAEKKNKNRDQALAQELEELVSQNKIARGMSMDQIRRSWGSPDKINSTDTEYSHSEQWVYPSNYVYFDDGICTAWQASK